MTANLENLFQNVLLAKSRHRTKRLFTVAISGIDASGKGYISKQLQRRYECEGYRIANINIDPWQNPLPVRLKRENPAENVYENIFRWNGFFEQLIFPLQKNKSICLETKGIQTEADIYFPLVYDLMDIDILLVEGIFLFKKKYLAIYDYRIWVECSFQTGLKRAIARNSEKLTEEQLTHDYNTYYYPAQLYHFKKDDPVANADIIFLNE